MRIHSWGQSGGVGATQAVSGSPATPPSNAANQTASDVSAQVTVSKPAELAQKLAALKISDPASFKGAANKLAEHFNNLASAAQGPERIGLSKLASTFANVAETGDLSALQPPGSPPPPPAAPDSDDDADPVVSGPTAPTVSAADRALTTAFSVVDSLASSDDDASSDPVAKLSALKTSNPAAFKQVMNRVAEQLSGFSNFATGDDAASLSKLAGSFANAAESGDLSGFKLESAAAAPANVPPPAAPPPPPAPVEDPRTTALDLVDELTESTGLTEDPLQKLKTLKGADYGAFSKVMNRVAERLDQLANFAEGDTRDGLSKLAGVFASGSESGDLRALEPAVTAPAQSDTPAQAPSNHWMSGHAMSSYHRNGPPPIPPQAIEDAYSSALTLLD